MTLRNATGATVVALCIFYDPATRLLRDGTYQTVQDGTKTGALVADNTTSQAITVVLSNDALGHPAPSTCRRMAGRSPLRSWPRCRLRSRPWTT
jgi:hypothetical protein